jgi:long-chain fatty acid transport protein
MDKKLAIAASAAVIVACSAPSGRALGTASYSSELISARSLGQGGTGVAGVYLDPISAYTNPAALSALAGTQITAGAAYVNSRPEFRSRVNSSGGLGGSYTASTDGSVSGARVLQALVPQFGASTQVMDGKLSFGLAFVTPYGLETHWNGDSPLRYQATDARLRVIDVTGAAAYRLNDSVSVGVGLDYYDTIEGQLDKKINTPAVNAALGAPGASADANSRLNGNGDGIGYHAGLTLRPNARHQVGLVYHSMVKMLLHGDVELTGLDGAAAGLFGGQNFTADAAAPLYIPQNVQLGYAYMPNERWQLEADAAWYDWSVARELGVVYSGVTSAQSGVLNNPASNPIRFNPRNTLSFGAGLNHKCAEALSLRGGFYYQAASLPERTFNASFVDLPRYGAAVGAGIRAGEDFTVDLAYNAVFTHARAVDAPATGGSGYKGDFSNFGSVFAASLTWRGWRR